MTDCVSSASPASVSCLSSEPLVLTSVLLMILCSLESPKSTFLFLKKVSGETMQTANCLCKCEERNSIDSSHSRHPSNVGGKAKSNRCSGSQAGQPSLPCENLPARGKTQVDDLRKDQIVFCHPPILIYRLTVKQATTTVPKHIHTCTHTHTPKPNLVFNIQQ